jgi:hypothetical protein
MTHQEVSPVSNEQPTDCGHRGHARRGCHCDRCEARRAYEREYQRRYAAANRERVRERQREHRKATNNAATKQYEKTPKGFLMRSYRNMKSRVEGVQKKGSWTGQEILPREDFYSWAIDHPDFQRLFTAYEESGFDRKLAPSPDRINSTSGYVIENMRWLTHSENSSLGGKSPLRKKNDSP